MDISIVSNVIALMISLGMFLLAWRRFPLEKKSNETDAAGEITESAVALLPPMRQRITELEVSLKEAREALYQKERELRTVSDDWYKKLSTASEKWNKERSELIAANQKTCEEMEKEKTDLIVGNDKLKRQYNYCTAKMAMYEDWTHRLVEQVRRLGGDPVSIENGGKKTGPLPPAPPPEEKA